MRGTTFLAAWLLLSNAMPGATEAGGISGTVRDTGGRALADADVQVQSESTGARWKTSSDENGHYAVAGLPEGRYKVTVRLGGFRTVSRLGVAVGRDSGAALDFNMELLGLHEVITVVGGRDETDPSAGDSLLVTRTSPGANLPTNGQDFRASFDLMPGVVVTPAGVSDAGQFTSNGQRPNTSAYRVDGISANTGVGGSALPGSFPGASLPAMTAIGSTENLVSPETTQSMELRTSSFAPEFGDRTGAEALITTRSGSNEFHGDLFGHLRDNGWTARDWFANSRGLAFPRPYYRSVGGVFGGPILRNRTFVFASAERSQLNFSGLELTSVPSTAARLSAPPALAGVLGVFPPPIGADFGDGTAEGILPLSRTAELASYSARIDQSLGSWGTLFGRMVESPSSSDSGYFNATNGRFNWTSGTIGLTAGKPGGSIHDLRFNYSRARFSTHLSDLWNVFELAGLQWFTPPKDLNLPPQGAWTVLGLSIPGLGQFVGGVMGSPRQDQWELRYTIAKDHGAHQVRAGMDYIRLDPSRDAAGASILAAAPSLQSLLQGGPLGLTYSGMPKYGDRIQTISLFAQDTWRISERLNLMYGLRWELTPPTGSNIQIPTVSGLWTGTEWQGAHSGNIDGIAPWPMRYGQVAPRIGLAYRMPGGSLVLRAGAGVFYDTALGAAIGPINGAPFNSWQLPAGATGASAAISNQAPLAWQGAMTPDVAQFLIGPVPALRLPASYQWRASMEKTVPGGGTASAAYVGSAGRNLPGNQAYVEPDTGVLTRLVTLTQNASNYQALQLRYAGSLGRRVYGSVAYTWSHSIDDGSQDSSVFLIHPGYSLKEARGSSSFDVRHALTGALSYQIPRDFHFGRRFSRLPDGLTGWTISGILRARSGFPIDVLNSEVGLGRAFENVGRPDLVAGVPLWIGDASVAGHRRLNPAAFTAAPANRLGTLGRNAITGNGLAQLDASLRRDFPLYRRLSLEVTVSVFNVLNHPAFADPVPYLSSPWFGQSTSMQNLMLGSGSPNSGLPPLFQTGGSRSGEISFRLSF